MVCEHCGQRQATVHHSVNVNGRQQESHFCEVCAQEKGLMMVQPNFAFPNLSIQQLLSSFLGQGAPAGPAVRRRQAEPQCKKCGMTYSQFAETGLLGCSHCYDDLEPHLAPLIKRIHGTDVHGGKAPKRTGGIVRKRREHRQLRQQLMAAIEGERYEEAARLRDTMKALEQEIAAGGGTEDVE